jgi:OOP family OmpA-OmpF porin
MKHPALRCTVTALLLSGVCSTYAADSYWYTGIGVGVSRAQFYPADFSSGGLYNETKNEYDAGFKAFMGYQINRNWGAEASYTTVGKFHYKYQSGAVTQDATYKVSGMGLSLVPTVPFTRNFSVYGRLGGFFSQARLTFYNEGFVVGASSSGRQFSDVTFLSGFGAQYFFGGENGIRIELENFGRVGNECSPNIPPGTCTGRANAKMISANAIFAF